MKDKFWRICYLQERLTEKQDVEVREKRPTEDWNKIRKWEEQQEQQQQLRTLEGNGVGHRRIFLLALKKGRQVFQFFDFSLNIQETYLSMLRQETSSEKIVAKSWMLDF